jgi:type IV pilus assembly protein PilE
MLTRTCNVPRAAGFTLIELMVTVVIATILITIAVPGYTSFILQSHRADAKTALLDFAQREERYMSTHSSYTTDPTQLGYATAQPVILGTNDYQLTVCVSTALPCTGNAATGTAFLITATAINNQRKDTTCSTFSVDSTGVQTAMTQAGAVTTSCW